MMNITSLLRLSFAIFTITLFGCSVPDAPQEAEKTGAFQSSNTNSTSEDSVQAKSDEDKEKGESISIGRRRTIHSKILNQDREYLVYLPDSYGTGSGPYLPQSYPVLFLFDGDIQFHVVTGMIHYMSGLGGQIPEMIVVGIPHQNRTRELTPTHTISDFREGKTSIQLKDSGGGEDFRAFVTRELIPKIDSDYRTRPYRILFGHSFGGLLAAHALLENDSSFQSFILADPSLWWHDRTLVKRLEHQLASKTFFDEKRAVYISSVEAYRAPGDHVTQKGFDNIKNSIAEFEKKTSVRQVDSSSDSRVFSGDPYISSDPDNLSRPSSCF